MKYHIEVRRADCISAAACVIEAPQTFRIDEEDIAVIIDPAGDDPESILAAAESCPTNAIVLVDTESGEQLWPEE
ncbi:MAG: ferredoxin [Myxococcota bacterium]|nr:ferredoxin [Myxococcota bacterium]